MKNHAETLDQNQTDTAHTAEEDVETFCNVLSLSLRQAQILILIVVLAKSNKEIAFDLDITEGGVKEYIYDLFQKLGVESRGELSIWWTTRYEHAGDWVTRENL